MLVLHVIGSAEVGTLVADLEVVTLGGKAVRVIHRRYDQMRIKSDHKWYLLDAWLSEAVFAVGPELLAGVLVAVQIQQGEVLSEVLDHLKLNYSLKIIKALIKQS